MERLDGRTYVQMLVCGAAILASHTQEINDLNVFPVADGDTGTNMSRTIDGGLSKTASLESESMAVISDAFSKGVLLSARGNSGVILSQFFAGICEGLSKYDTVNAKELARAYQSGVKKAYASVQNPTEGTILTVFRESSDYAFSRVSEKSTIEEFYEFLLEEARRSLLRTKEILPVLAEADVVDSGGAGYLYVAEGMYRSLIGKATDINYVPSLPKDNQEIDISSFTRDSVLEYGYCTEFLLRLTSAKCDPDSFEVNDLVGVLEKIGGNSIVAYKQDDIVKVHVHTFTPGEVLSLAQKYGEFLTVKIENMSLGHSETNEKPKPKKHKKYSVVSVASGEGISSLFEDLGADTIISGGQSFNPSIEDFIEAFEKLDTENIILFPNNKNVILGAKQAAEIYDRAKVYVVETKNMMQGFSALSVITPGITDIEALVSSAEKAAKNAVCCEITAAVRDAVFGDIKISKGDYLAMLEGDIISTAKNAEEAVKVALENVDMDLCEIITLFVGKNTSDDKRVELTEELEELYPDCEVVVYIGGQDIYDYMIAIE